MRRERFRLALRSASRNLAAMWDEPYLETCCRSALHRLVLAGGGGRPPDLKDLPCLERLDGMGMAEPRDGRYRITETGRRRHASEVLSTG